MPKPLFLCIALFSLLSCRHRGNGHLFHDTRYTLYMVYHGVPPRADEHSNVALEGLSIGHTGEVIAADSNRVVLELQITRNIKIPRYKNVTFRETVWKENFVDISSPGPDTLHTSVFLNDKDTVYAAYMSLAEALEATKKTKLYQQLKDLKKGLDSVAARDSALIR